MVWDYTPKHFEINREMLKARLRQTGNTRVNSLLLQRINLPQPQEYGGKMEFFRKRAVQICEIPPDMYRQPSPGC
jgi:hypothetical protein